MLDNRSTAFTGDCLLARGSTWADFREAIPVPCTNWCAGASSACPTRVCPISLSIPGLRITSVGEERQFNPRLSGEIGEADFTGYMKNLRLAHPKKMDVAVPANLKCGRPETDPDVAEARTGRRSNRDQQLWYPGNVGLYRRSPVKPE